MQFSMAYVLGAVAVVVLGCLVYLYSRTNQIENAVRQIAGVVDQSSKAIMQLRNYIQLQIEDLHDGDHDSASEYSSDDGYASYDYDSDEADDRREKQLEHRPLKRARIREIRESEQSETECSDSSASSDESASSESEAEPPKKEKKAPVIMSSQQVAPPSKKQSAKAPQQVETSDEDDDGEIYEDQCEDVSEAEDPAKPVTAEPVAQVSGAKEEAGPNQCPVTIKFGQRKGKLCLGEIVEGSQFCKIHMKSKNSGVFVAAKQ